MPMKPLEPLAPIRPIEANEAAEADRAAGADKVDDKADGAFEPIKMMILIRSRWGIAGTDQAASADQADGSR